MEFTDHRDNLIAEYFNMGLPYPDIVTSLASNHQIVLSLRHLKRLLRAKGLCRKQHFTDDAIIAEFIDNELKNSGGHHGYKWMHLKCLHNGFTVTQEKVRLIIKELDPIGVETRKKHRLQRRQYHNKGPNFLWHFDGYDKLKPYGICISGCSDGFSRYILWLEAYRTNSDPKVIAGYFMETVEKIKGCPRAIRADCGTENGHVRDMQISLRIHNNDDPLVERYCFLYGKSTANQRIESWWAILRREKTQFWMNIFEGLKNEGQFQSTDIDKELIRFCFLRIIQDDLDKLAAEWNCHLIRRTKNAIAPHGRPVMMYTNPDQYGGSDYLHSADQGVIDACKEECRFREEIPCEQSIYDFATQLMQDGNLNVPTDVNSSIHLYLYLRERVVYFLDQ